MIIQNREPTQEEKAEMFDMILDSVTHWTNCDLKEVDARNYQGRCGRIGWDVRNILYKAKIIKAVAL